MVNNYITFDIITDTKRVASSQSSFDKQLESLQYNEFYDKDWVDNAYAGRLTEDVIYEHQEERYQMQLEILHLDLMCQLEHLTLMIPPHKVIKTSILLQ